MPSGAFWGAEDVRKMADRGTLQVSHGVHILWNSCATLVPV